MVFENTYTTGKASEAEMNVAALPGGASSALFVVASKKPGEVLRDGCREAAGTLYCEVRASSGHGTIEEQTKEMFASPRRASKRTVSSSMTSRRPTCG